MGQTWRRKDFKSLPALGTTTLRTFSRLQGLYLLHHGRLIGQGTPQEILTDPKLLYAAGLAAPAAVRAYYDLAERGIRLPRCPLTNAELVEELCRLQ